MATGSGLTALIEHVRANPDVEEPYLVLSDVLLESGDPRGELILLHHMLGGTHHHPLQTFRSSERRAPLAWREASDADLFAEANRLVNENAEHFYGRFGERVDITWFMGYAQRAKLAHKFKLRERDALRALEQLFAHDSALFLRELVCTDLFSGSNTRYDGVTRVIATNAPPTLTGVETGSKESTCALGNVTPLLSRDGLRFLELQGYEMAINPGTTSPVHELQIAPRGPTPELVDGFVGTAWNELEALGIWFDEATWGGYEEAVTTGQRLLTLKAEKLRKLWLVNCHLGDAVARALPDVAVARQLTDLSITFSSLTDVGALALAEEAGGTLRNLKNLDLRSTAIYEKGAAALSEAFGDRVRLRLR